MILGIDPWIRKLWYALIRSDLDIVEAWILKLELKNGDRFAQFQRLADIEQYFSDFFDKYKDISCISMEKYYFTKFNLANAEFVFGMRAIILILAIKKGIQIKEYSPLELKKNITWNGKAWKEMVQKFIMKMFHLQEIPEYHDAADALGLAYLWLQALKNSVKKFLQ